MPPAALISFTASLMPLSVETPKVASLPVIDAKCPTLISSSARVHAATAVSDAAASAIRRKKRLTGAFISSSPWCRLALLPRDPSVCCRPMWRPDLIADAAAAALERHACELELAQSVRGLDALAELAFHPLLAAAFRDAGWQVLSECPYPREVSRRPGHAERERCDLVLTDAGLTLT